MAELARLWGVSLGYRDASGRARESPRQAVMEVLEALHSGMQVREGATPRGDRSSLGDRAWLREALAARRSYVQERLVEPVLVAWDGRLRVSVPRNARATLMTEDGHERQEGTAPGPTRDLTNAVGDHRSWRQRIPFGYHRLRVEGRGRLEEATVICAPKRCWQHAEEPARWGVFAPLYALSSPRDWGAGDLAELGGLLDMVSRAGGSSVATLPLLASYLDRPFEPSPYSPVSRLFWNEFYIAVDHSPEWAGCASARAVWESPDTRRLLQEWRSGSLVDYAAVMRLKRRALEELSRHFFERAGDGRRDALDAFVRGRPEVTQYAEFRARVEAHGCDWRSWPRHEQQVVECDTRAEGLSETARYHLYCQWLVEEQLGDLSDRSSREGEHGPGDRSADLFLDLPVGVHPGGFDAWRHQGLFVRGMSIGAPPDAFFSGGQTWCSPPLHPERIREGGLSHWAQILRNHMRFAARLRLDHVMALHRTFWIPEGREPGEGVYVDYPTEELYAVLCLESQRNRTLVTGEDLGTVPPGVRASMRRRGVSRTWVLQGGIRPRAEPVIAPVPKGAVVSLGTHDMFPFAGFLGGEDIEMRLQTGQLTEAKARRTLDARSRMVERLSEFLLGEAGPKDPAVLLKAVLSHLADSRSESVVVSLADLLLEHHPHNAPGTSQETNWRRRFTAGEEKIAQVIADAASTLSRTESSLGQDPAPRP